MSDKGIDLAKHDGSEADDCERAANFMLMLAETNQLSGSMPRELRPRSRRQAYEIQSKFVQKRMSSIRGWKIAATSAAGQAHINVSGPIAGRLLDDDVHVDGSSVSLCGNSMRLAELEFVFVMKRTIDRRDRPYTRDEMTAAVGALHIGVELPGSRFSSPIDAGELQLIADNACAQDFVLGPPVHYDSRSDSLVGVEVFATADGPSGRREAMGRGANVLGDPVDALLWLANELRKEDLPLEAGQFVTTGTCCTPFAVEPGDAIEVTFKGLGSMGLKLTD